MRNELTRDLDEMEDLCCITETLPDIWQTRVIRTLCKVLYHVLLYLTRRDRHGTV